MVLFNKRHNKYKSIILFLSIALSYFIAGKMGLMLAFVHTSSTAVWAPTGIALAACLLFGYRFWPAIFIAAFLTNLTTAGSVATSLGIATGNTLEAVIGAYLVNHFAHGRNAFLRAQDLFRFTVLAALLSTTVSANIGVTSLILGGYAQWSQFLPIWFTWWMGDATGALIVAPFIIFWAARHPLYSSKSRKLEALIAFSVLILVSVILFGGIAKTYPLTFICLPVIGWIAFRFGRRETVSAIVLFACFAIWGTLQGFGPFAVFSKNTALLMLQIFMDVTTLTALALSVAVAEGRKIEERLQSTLNNMSEGFQIIGFDWRFLYVNKEVIKQGRKRKDELLGRTMMEMYPGIEKTDLFVHLKRSMQERVPHHMETKFDFPDGSTEWFELRIEPISEGISILSLDITERRKNQEKVAHEKAEDEALLASIGDGIIATDPDGKIILVNRAFEELLGWRESEVIGKSEVDLFAMQDEKGIAISVEDRPLKLVFAKKKKITATHYLVRKDNTKFPSLITVSPIILDKKVIGVVKVFHDITREKEIDEMKTEFISLASHELRTPLSAIRGLVAMIHDGDYGPINQGLKRPLTMISTSTERLIHIVNEMLDVSRIEAGRLHFSLIDYDIHELLKEGTAALQNLADRKNIKLIIKQSPALFVQTDKEKFIEIINNLVGNSLKFTQKGSITISVEQKDDKIIVFVTDTGIGIAKEDQSKLFSKFDEIKLKQAGKTTGTGLGLYISHEFVKKMGGVLWIERSVIDKGSIFAFSLPMANTFHARKVKKEIG